MPKSTLFSMKNLCLRRLGAKLSGLHISPISIRVPCAARLTITSAFTCHEEKNGTKI